MEIIYIKVRRPQLDRDSMFSLSELIHPRRFRNRQITHVSGAVGDVE